MTRILIVEDEFMVAANLEDVLIELGMDVVGIAPNRETAQHLAQRGVDIAFVDLNLQDGFTGPEIGHTLAAEAGATVIFMTANPRLIADGVDCTLGVVSKPVADSQIAPLVNFALRTRQGLPSKSVPPGLRLFSSAGCQFA